jgi:hypothetical protein
VVRVGQRGGSWRLGRSPAWGSGRRNSETEREGREEDDEDLCKIFQKGKGFTLK